MIGELFDPQAELDIGHYYRPHWSQAGAVVFATFRTKDSIPRGVLLRWHREKREWLERQGIRCNGDIEFAVSQLSIEDADAFRKHFNRQRETLLDECRGRCLLGRRDLAEIVAESLLHFDGERYHLGDFIVMPNHVESVAGYYEGASRAHVYNNVAWTLTTSAHEFGRDTQRAVSLAAEAVEQMAREIIGTRWESPSIAMVTTQEKPIYSPHIHRQRVFKWSGGPVMPSVDGARQGRGARLSRNCQASPKSRRVYRLRGFRLNP